MNFMGASIFGVAILFMPILTYLAYIVVCATIDLLQAILAVPGKIDGLKK